MALLATGFGALTAAIERVVADSADTASSVEETSATAEELAHLNELHDSGALSDEEFARAKELALRA